MVEPLNEKGLEAAEDAWNTTDLGLRWKLSDAIRAYLGALPAPDGELVERLRTVANMIDTGEKIRWGEETALMEQAASTILSLQRERDELAYGKKLVADFVRPRIPPGQNIEQAESFLAWIGMIARLEERGEKAIARAEAAEAQVSTLTRERDEAREEHRFALKLLDDEAKKREAAEAQAQRYRAALEKISSPTQTNGLLWWQIEARAALSDGGRNG